MRGATLLSCQVRTHSVLFQSTPPMRGATDRKFKTIHRRTISIHAPHAGSDNDCVIVSPKTVKHFNPRPPCGERPEELSQQIPGLSDFNPRPPCGERPRSFIILSSVGLISIHAPHAGSDQIYLSVNCGFTISIHAPHAGSDLTSFQVVG